MLALGCRVPWEHKVICLRIIISTEVLLIIFLSSVEIVWIEELKKEEYNQKKQKLTDNQIEVLEVMELANGLEITAKDIEEKLDIKQASEVRILKSLAKKGFLIEDKKTSLESRGAVLTFKIKPF